MAPSNPSGLTTCPVWMRSKNKEQSFVGFLVLGTRDMNFISRPHEHRGPLTILHFPKMHVSQMLEGTVELATQFVGPGVK